MCTCFYWFIFVKKNLQFSTHNNVALNKHGMLLLFCFYKRKQDSDGNEYYSTKLNTWSYEVSWDNSVSSTVHKQILHRLCQVQFCGTWGSSLCRRLRSTLEDRRQWLSCYRFYHNYTLKEYNYVLAEKYLGSLPWRWRLSCMRLITSRHENTRTGGVSNGSHADTDSHEQRLSGTTSKCIKYLNWYKG